MTEFRQPFVIARDPERKRILLGGLGGLFVGEMWFDEKDHHIRYPGYNQAEIRTAPNGPFTDEMVERNIRAEAESFKLRKH